MTNKAPSPDPAFLDSLAEALAGTWPSPQPENASATARAALDALEPADLIEAMLAARLLAAHHATVDGYRRAMQQGTSNADSVSLRNNAVAVARSFDAALRLLDKRRAPAEQPVAPHARPRPRPTDAQPPAEDELAIFTPEQIAEAEHALDNDPVKRQQAELAKRVPLDRWQDMTMEERRLANAPSAPLTPVQLAVLGARMAAANRHLSGPAQSSG